MKRKIFAGVFAFILAMLLVAGCSYLFVLPFIMDASPSLYIYLFLIMDLIVGNACVALAITGGVYAILGKRKGFVLVWIATGIAASPIAFVVAFSGILNLMVGWAKALTIIDSFLPLVFGCAVLILAEKPKNTLAYIINFCSFVALFTYSIFYLGSGFALITLIAMLGLVIQVVETLKVRAREYDKLTKSI